MTTFDRAFIKAFTDSPAHPAAPPEQAVAPPHGPQAKPPRARLGASPARASEMGGAPSREFKTPPPPRPLSSFAPQPRLQDPCRALLEVDRFNWPPAVDELLSQASREWETFAAGVVDGMGQGKKCLAFASLDRGDGRTTLTLALARQLASRGMRPVVVDADNGHPELAHACGISVHTGWDDLLESELILGEALIAAVEEGVTLMPWRVAVPGGKSLPSSLRVSGLFGSLREHYDLVLIDVGPLAGKTAIADFAAFGTAVHLDALYLTHNLALPQRESLAATCTKLRNAGVAVAGVIENFVSAGATAPSHTVPAGSTALVRRGTAARGL